MFLGPPDMTPAARRFLDEDLTALGFEMNATKLWAYQPETQEGLFELLGSAKRAGDLSMRDMGILVTATASTLGDSYCSLAWGMKLSREADAATAAGVLTGDDTGLTPAETALVRWARRVVSDPNATTADDVQDLRDAGFDDQQIFAITVVIALRLAFSTINDALGATPDHGLEAIVPGPVREAVTYGRPMDDPPDDVGP